MSDDTKDLPLISIITVCLNSAATIERTILSVASQTYSNIEFIIIDGGSTDGTLSILDNHKSVISHLVIESDDGIYDAMNKGVNMAKGTWIHILNSDDYYPNSDVLKRAIKKLDSNFVNYFQIWRQASNQQFVLQDWIYRRWQLFVSAFLPHPGLIVSRTQYDAVGLYNTSYKIAADHDMILRLTAKWSGLKHNLALVVMDQGGISAAQLEVSMKEFRIVTEQHGLPRPIASVVTKLKKIWWRI